MKLALLCLTCALSAASLRARAQEPDQNGPLITRAEAEAKSEGKPDVVGAALAHITDSHTLELQLPWPINSKFEVTTPVWKIQLGSFSLDLSITKHVIWMWVACLLMFLVLWASTARRRGGQVPQGVGLAVEEIVLFVRGIAVRAIGEHDADNYVPYLCTIFFFVMFCGLVGCLPFTATATGNIAVTAGLAICTFVLTQIAGMKHQGVVGYWTHLVPAGVPWWLYPVMVPVEVLGLFTKPFALTIRLFANMIAGHLMILILLGLGFFLGSQMYGLVSVLFGLFVYALELLVIGVQALIFTLLSASFIGLASHSH